MMISSTKVFQIGIDPVRERAGLLLAARTIACVRYFAIEFALDQLRSRQPTFGGNLQQQIEQIERQFKRAKEDKGYTESRSVSANNEHDKLFQGDPRMILTPEEKSYIETNLRVPGLRMTSSFIEELLNDALIIGVSAATSDYNRPPEACPHCGSRGGGSVRGIVR